MQPLTYKNDTNGEHALSPHDFELRARQMRQSIYHFAYRQLGNTAEAEDVTQETFARAWASLERFDTRHCFASWLFRITRNIIIDLKRRQRRRITCSLETLKDVVPDGAKSICEPLDYGADPAVPLLTQEISEPILLALRTLPEEYRTTLLMVYHEISYEQIAAKLNCPVGTVRSRLNRARQQARNVIEQIHREMQLQ